VCSIRSILLRLRLSQDPLAAGGVKKVLIRPSPQEYCVHPREDCRLDTAITDLAMITKQRARRRGLGQQAWARRQ
jgi:hypothetical protein